MPVTLSRFFYAFESFVFLCKVEYVSLRLCTVEYVGALSIIMGMVGSANIREKSVQ